MKQITEINSKFDLKKVVVIMAAICMMVTILPMVDASDSDDLQTAINNTATGGVLALDRNYTITAPVTINKSMTIDGTGSKYSITNSSGSNAINVTSNGVTIKNLSITTNGSAYSINGTGSDLTVMDCTISSTGRGINFYTGTNGATLTVTGTGITNPSVDAYGVNYGTDNRGIATGNVIAGDVTISSCNINGFKYGINVVVDDQHSRNGSGTVFNITNTTVRGWAALNISCADTTFDLNNCNMTGVNKFSNGSNDYSIINVNEVAYSTTHTAVKVNFRGGEYHVLSYGLCLESLAYVDVSGFTEYKFYRDSSNAKVKVYEYDSGSNTAGLFTFQASSNVNQTIYLAKTLYRINADIVSATLPPIPSQ